jgi:Domain of unknown function (DU1801)
MAENKTKLTAADVGAFLEAVPNERRRADAKQVCAMMERLSGEPPRMWGPTMVGFGRYHYKYESGREGDAMRIGFSPRSAALVLYVLDGFPRQDEILARLGKYTAGKCCLYIKKLSDIDESALEELIGASLDYMRELYG